MSEITNFPMYKSKENIITNHTMFLLSRLYNYSTEKFQLFISSLLETEEVLSTTIFFGQQEKTPDSIIDGLIYQQSFKILIETKRGNNFTVDQIKRHLSGFENEDNKVLLLVGSEPARKIKLQELKEETVYEYNKSNDSETKLINVTFKEIINNFKEVIEKFDIDMWELIDDYEILCENQKLLNKKDTRLRAVPCGDSFDLNMNYDIYYMSSNKGYKLHNYIGLYKNKCIKAIGKIKKVVVVDYNLDIEELSVIEGDELNFQEEKKIIEVIKEAYDKIGHKTDKDTRFFLVNRYYRTEYKKTSKYGMMGARYFDLSEILDDSIPETAKDIAKKLSTLEW